MPSRAAQVVPATAHRENTDDGDGDAGDADGGDKHGGTGARAPPGRDKIPFLCRW